uniref:Uncharacterized protein n=1 Tax=Engystomops pustulosus TaxID=76066 RepID=A0AAV6YWQ7_ENGPU|nr:hypothetical protein GDO81_028242 [Engystomops pustulosus]
MAHRAHSVAHQMCSNVAVSADAHPKQISSAHSVHTHLQPCGYCMYSEFQIVEVYSSICSFRHDICSIDLDECTVYIMKR